MAPKTPSEVRRQYKYGATEAEQDILREAADDAGVTVSTYVLEAALGRSEAVSTERHMDHLALLERAIAGLHDIAENAGSGGSGILILKRLERLERTLRVLASVREIRL